MSLRSQTISNANWNHENVDYVLPTAVLCDEFKIGNNGLVKLSLQAMSPKLVATSSRRVLLLPDISRVRRRATRWRESVVVCKCAVVPNLAQPKEMRSLWCLSWAIRSRRAVPDELSKVMSVNLIIVDLKTNN